MSVSYYVSAKKSTVVSQTEVGNFTCADSLNLIINRGNRLDVQLVTPEGLKSVCEIPVYGRITNIQLFRPKNSNQDLLIVLTEKHQMAILGYENSKLVTRAAGNIADRVGRLTDHGTIITVHKTGLIAVRLYDGTLKFVDWEKTSDLKHFNVRFDSINVIDVKFMDTNDDLYRLAYISEDAQGRHLRIVDLGMNDKEFRPYATQENIANDSSFIINVPHPAGGVIILGMNTILYKPNDDRSPVVPVSSPLTCRTTFTSYARVDQNGERFLLADDQGRLLMLLLNIESFANGTANVQEMRVEYLGETSVADTVRYLDNSVVFIGSRLGDSQLIRLASNPNIDGTFIEVLETYTNIGPIRDMIHVENEGQTQLVTVSGAYKEGTLRIVRNGIGIEEAASVELPNVETLFPLRINSKFDNYLVVSLPNETHVLEINGEELEDVQLLDVNMNAPTLLAGTLFQSDIIVQVTKTEIRTMKKGESTRIWKPDNAQNISKVAANLFQGQIVVAAKDTLYYLKCSEGSLLVTEISKRVMNEEVACIDISNEEDDSRKEANFVVITLWNAFSLEVATLNDFKTHFETFLPTKTLPRSVVATFIDGINYLLIALGDGVLLYFTYDISNGKIGEPKKTSVGTRPPSLHRVQSKNRQHLFVCSDRPVIIFSFNKKLVFSNVNVKLVTAICSLQSSAYQDCLVISDGQTMVFGSVDDIQKIHVRTIPMGESVRRIAYQKSTGTYAVVSIREDDALKVDKYVCASKTAMCTTFSHQGAQRADIEESPVTEVSSVMILDQHTFQVLHTHEFGYRESAVSIISGQLGTDKCMYYIVGTAIINPEEAESKQGRLIIFEVDSCDKTKLRKVAEKDIRGSPYSMNILNGKLLVAINSAVRMFEWDGDKDLRHECANFNNITAISVKTMGDQILVADLMRSMKILTYRSMEGTFEEVAKDANCMWMSACEFITAERVLGAELQHNLFTCEIDKSRVISEDGKYLLEPTGFFYLGEMVNVMRRCTLITPPVDSIIQTTQPIMFGTVDGSIGMIVQIDEKWKKFLQAIEKCVSESIKNCLQIDHSTYRTFNIRKRNEPPTGFVDGDLIESILDVERSEALKILERVAEFGLGEGIPSDPAEILKIIEDLSRIH